MTRLPVLSCHSGKENYRGRAWGGCVSDTTWPVPVCAVQTTQDRSRPQGVFSEIPNHRSRKSRSQDRRQTLGTCVGPPGRCGLGLQEARRAGPGTRADTLVFTARVLCELGTLSTELWGHLAPGSAPAVQS